MLADLSIAGMLAGGVGIFLLAVGMITDGLKHAAGSGLRSLLGKWTRSPIHGVFTGFLITAVVQSSSAITVATIGFVNAGLMTLTQALGVIFGANIGTTITGWLVAIIGFEINISAIALPIIGVGMLLRLTGGQSRSAAVGTALVGFGLFFIGIQVLKDAFEGIVATLDMERFTLNGLPGLLFYLGLGFLMTVLTQSSSAAIAITLTATSGGLIGLYAAGAMVIGANVGTTSTAVLSVLGATASAKRVAAAHVLFNSITGLVALILLPIMFYLVNSIAELLNVEAIPTVTLALFHTVFNVLGVVLMLPFTARLAAFLGRHFTTREETLGKPRFLDKNILATPDLALNAAVLELGHLAGLTRQLCKGSAGGKKQAGDRQAKGKQAIGEQGKSNNIALHAAVEQLALSIGEFVMQLQRSSIPKNVAETLPTILRSNQYFLNAAELAVEVQTLAPQLDSIDDPEMVTTLSGFNQKVDSLLTLADPDSPYFSAETLAQNLALLKKQYEQQKEDNLQRALEISLSVRTVSELLESNSNARRMVAQFGKGVATLVDLREQVLTGDTESEEFNELSKPGS
jgi:phosphate:Na+ symporter